MGIDLACRAAHVASLAGPDGTLLWRGRSFFTRPADLEKLWRDLACDPAELTVVMEPTRNAWIPVAAWFRRRGARVVLVPTTQSADLRAYYAKHTKNDRLDSAILARLPLLHPEGLREHVGDGPADPLRRIVKQRSSIAKRRSAIFHRLDAQLELLGPAWYDVLGTDYGKAALQFLAHYADRTPSSAWAGRNGGGDPRSPTPVLVRLRGSHQTLYVTDQHPDLTKPERLFVVQLLNQRLEAAKPFGVGCRPVPDLGVDVPALCLQDLSGQRTGQSVEVLT